MIAVLRSSGPLTFAELRRECGLPLDSARNIINQLQEEEIISRIIVVGLHDYLPTVLRRIRRNKKH